jgi:hypothetical protein
LNVLKLQVAQLVSLANSCEIYQKVAKSEINGDWEKAA